MGIFTIRAKLLQRQITRAEKAQKKKLKKLITIAGKEKTLSDLRGELRKTKGISMRGLNPSERAILEAKRQRIAARNKKIGKNIKSSLKNVNSTIKFLAKAGAEINRSLADEPKTRRKPTRKKAPKRRRKRRASY